MWKIIKKYLIILLFIVFVTGGVYYGLQVFSPNYQGKITKQVKKTSTIKKKLHFTAIGDSLTEGIGDKENGGYLSVTANALQDDFNVPEVTSKNFGIAGNTSEQILKRIKEQGKMRKDLRNADFVTVTVGGNDVMAVIRKELLDVTKDSFIKPRKTYQENLQQIITEIRKENPEAPIYLYGIYNPFYLYFADIKEMEDIIIEWNKASEAIVKNLPNVHFVSISHLLEKGTGTSDESENNEKKQTKFEKQKALKNLPSSRNKEKESPDNDLLYEADHFHPNHAGYQKMAQALIDELSKTKKQWLYEGND